jgi:carbamoyltransferase
MGTAMATGFGRSGPTHPRLGAADARIARPLLTRCAGHHQFCGPYSACAHERGVGFVNRLRRGETPYLLGISPSGHDNGVALIEVSQDAGVNLICNNEAERYHGVPHCSDYPRQSLDALQALMHSRGISPREIHACLASWDYIALGTTLFRTTSLTHRRCKISLAR